MFNGSNSVFRVVGEFFNPPDPPIVFSEVLAFVRAIEQNEIAGKATSECFRGKLWCYRNPGIDQELPAQQSPQTAGSTSVFRLKIMSGVTPREIAIAALGLPSDTALDELAGALRERDFTLTLPAIGNLVERREDGESDCLRDIADFDEHCYLAFVENNEGGVSLIFLNRVVTRWSRMWQSRIVGFDDLNRWFSGNYLLLRNQGALAP